MEVTGHHTLETLLQNSFFPSFCQTVTLPITLGTNTVTHLVFIAIEKAAQVSGG